MRSQLRPIVLPLLFALAATVALGHSLYLDAGEGAPVRVEVSGTPHSVQLAGGRSVIAWSQEDAAAIIAALRVRHLEGAIPQVLGGLRQGSAGISCLTLDLEDYGPLRISVPGTIEADQAGHVVWTERQVAAIAGALDALGHGHDLALVFGLHKGAAIVTASFADGPTPIASRLEPTPLNPVCGECAAGKECIVKTRSTCCATNTSTDCTLCKVCAPKLELEN